MLFLHRPTKRGFLWFTAKRGPTAFLCTTCGRKKRRKNKRPNPGCHLKRHISLIQRIGTAWPESLGGGPGRRRGRGRLRPQRSRPLPCLCAWLGKCQAGAMLACFLGIRPPPHPPNFGVPSKPRQGTVKKDNPISLWVGIGALWGDLTSLSHGGSIAHRTNDVGGDWGSLTACSGVNENMFSTFNLLILVCLEENVLAWLCMLPDTQVPNAEAFNTRKSFTCLHQTTSASSGTKLNANTQSGMTLAFGGPQTSDKQFVNSTSKKTYLEAICHPGFVCPWKGEWQNAKALAAPAADSLQMFRPFLFNLCTPFMC